MYNMYAARGTILHGVTCTPIVGLSCFDVAFGRCVCYLVIGFARVPGAREPGVFVSRVYVVSRWNIMIMLGFVASCDLGLSPIYLFVHGPVLMVSFLTIPCPSSILCKAWRFQG